MPSVSHSCLLPAPFSLTLFYGMSHKGESRSWVIPNPQLGACVQRASASDSLSPKTSMPAQNWESCTGQVTHTGNGGVLGEAKHPPWYDPSSEAVLPGRSRQPGSPFPPQAASGHDTSPNTCHFPRKPHQYCSTTKAQYHCCCQTQTAVVATAATNPKQGHLLPWRGKTWEATGDNTRAAQHLNWGSTTRSCFAPQGSPLAGGAMPPPAKVSPQV